VSVGSTKVCPLMSWRLDC